MPSVNSQDELRHCRDGLRSGALLQDAQQRGGSRGAQQRTCDERGGVCADRLLPQGHDRHQAEDAYGDEAGFDKAGGDVAQGKHFVVALQQREQRERTADVRDSSESGWSGAGDGSIWLTEINGTARSRTLLRRPCSAA